jgi:AcrR family transcriptional regulator
MALSPPDADITPARERVQPSLPRGPHQLTAEDVLDNQRSRLIEALVDLIGLQGYPATSVADVVALSGVSRRSFYELFPNRAEILKSAFEESSASMLEQVHASCERPTRGMVSRLEALLRPLCRCAHEQPGAVALWTVEIAADPEGSRMRGELMDQYAELIEGVVETESDPPPPYSLAVNLAGALHREIDSTARDTRTSISLDLPSRLARWAACYFPLPQALVFETAEPGPRAEPDRLLGGRAPGTLTPIADGYLPRIGSASSGFRAHANRERILDAVAQITAESGSATLGAQAILERAEVPENFFRAEFKNAKGAFLAALELGHLKCQAAVERARAEKSSWREGVSAAVQALLEFFASETSFARLALVDAPFAWPASSRRSSEHLAVYARLMFSGAPRQRRPIALAPEVTTQALIELVFRAATNERLPQLIDAAPEAVYLALAPFLGIDDAAEAAQAAGEVA